MKYTLTHFIEKFEAIPEEKWTTGTHADNHGRHDAYGHCGETGEEHTDEAEALFNIARVYGYITEVNDGVEAWNVPNTTPKQRVLTFLKSIKKTREQLGLLME